MNMKWCCSNSNRRGQGWIKWSTKSWWNRDSISSGIGIRDSGMRLRSMGMDARAHGRSSGHAVNGKECHGLWRNTWPTRFTASLQHLYSIYSICTAFYSIWAESSPQNRYQIDKHRWNQTVSEILYFLRGQSGTVLLDSINQQGCLWHVIGQSWNQTTFLINDSSGIRLVSTSLSSINRALT